MSKIKLPIIILCFLLVGTALYFVSLKFIKANLKQKAVVGMTDSQSTPVSDDAEKYARTVKALNEGWDNIELGNAHKRAGRYDEAVIAYKKAYAVDPGNRLLAGGKLIELYENLSRYNEAISMVNEILKTQSLGEYGIQKYTSIRDRLLAAKNQALQDQVR